MRPGALVCVLAFVFAAPVAAHVPGTAIGQAVQVLRAVPVSYENGAAVSELEADAFGRLPGVGEGIAVAALPYTALQEVTGGSNSVAKEVAQEAGLHGTLVVLAGGHLGAWSDEISPARLQGLVRQARVAALVASIQAEPRPSGQDSPWTTILIMLALLCAVGTLLLVVAGRRRNPGVSG